MSVAIRLVGISRFYGAGESLVRAVDEVDLEVESGESVVVTGPSGCGKSTLLQIAGGLDRPDGGEVWWGGQRVDQSSERTRARLRRARIGFVFQEFHLMDELTALENVELPALIGGTRVRRARERAEELLATVGLSDRLDHLPSALSGGQKQRVAVARALVNAPDVLLADEPTGNLDSVATREVLRLFASLRESGQTVVVVTHDPRTAATADRIVTLRDGTVVEDVALRPVDVTTRGVLSGEHSS